ncbi:class I SAM-dependent methyltransferase [Patescibacteria group bacterium]
MTEVKDINIDYAEHYDALADNIEMFNYPRKVQKHENRRFDSIHDLVDFSKDAKILDSGAGDGPLTAYFAKKGYKNIIGMDISPRRIERLNNYLKTNNLPGKGVAGDVFNHPFADEEFDVVISSEVIEHLHDPRTALREFYRILKPGGTLLLSTMENENVKQERCIHCNSLTPRSGHVQSFTEDGLRKMFKEIGLEVEEVSHVLSSLNANKLAGLVTDNLPFRIWKPFDRLVLKSGKFSNRWIALRAHKI